MHIRISVLLLLLTLAGSAHALPAVGTPPAPATVEALGGESFKTRDLRGKTTLIFYENKDTTKQNRALKLALERQKKREGYGENVRIVAVADVSAWNFWPAKGFVQDAIREQEHKAGYPIYLDWSGDFGKSLKANDNASNVVLVGPDGKVKLTHAGTVPATKILEILMATGKR